MIKEIITKIKDGIGIEDKIEKVNDLKINHSFSIPKEIQDDINEKWFYLYNWIWEQDVKESIERDFLKLIDKIGIALSIALIGPSIVFLLLEFILGFYIYFFWFLLILNIYFLYYLTNLAIKRSSILRKNYQVLITDSAISINWKIRDLEENKIISNSNLNNIWTLFEEELFAKSNISNSKKWLKDKVTKQLLSWYWKILKLSSNTSSRNRNQWGWIMILFALYTIYIASLAFIYLFWIFFIAIFWKVLSIINKKILLIRGHEVTTINNNFKKIDKQSLLLIKEKNNLTILLNQANKSEWKDSLLTKINSWIKKINSSASVSIDVSIKLKQNIQKSEYKKMFNFSIYNSWIKKQIYIPLKQISDLLQKNLDKLNENKISIEKEIIKTIDESFKWPLIASKTRTIIMIQDVEKHILNMNTYINKLKIK